MLFIVPTPSRELLSYSPRVCRALSAIRAIHLAEEQKLDAGERLEFAVACELLARALLLESAIRGYAAPE